MLPEALPYHVKVRDYFKQQAPTWDFFAAARTKEEQLASFQMELLKNTYQFQRSSNTPLYDKIDLARERLDLGSLPVTAYQAEMTNDAGLNASIVYLHQQAHMVFSGPILQRLNEEELLAVIAHELTHVRLYSLLNGELEVADRIITAIANNYNSEPAYYETARLFRLYTEIYCDRGAWTVLGNAGPVISMLLKVATGLPEVNVDSYIQQAEAIFSAAPGTQSATPTHPENFIRTRALHLWQDQQTAAEPAITGMIEGRPDLDRLDIFSQRELSGLTRDFLQLFLEPRWFQTTMVDGLARQYFADFNPTATDAARERLMTALTDAHPSIRDYFSYVLLDFTLADPSLEILPAGRAFQFADELQLSGAYDPIYKKELQISDKKWDQYRQQILIDYATVPKE